MNILKHLFQRMCKFPKKQMMMMMMVILLILDPKRNPEQYGLQQSNFDPFHLRSW